MEITKESVQAEINRVYPDGPRPDTWAEDVAKVAGFMWAINWINENNR